MSVKALEELRGLRDEAASKQVDNPKWVCRRAEEIADRIEAEIAERFMPLPCDGNGVPIRVGDKLECHANGYDGTFTVFAIGNDVVVGNHDTEWIARNPIKWFHIASFCMHVKPRTLEDVLSEMLDRNGDGIGLREFNGDFAAFVEHYADEIRELMGAES